MYFVKNDGDKLFKDLLTNKIFSKQFLSLNFKRELCLNKGLVWGFLGLKSIILPAFRVTGKERQESSRISRHQK